MSKQYSFVTTWRVDVDLQDAWQAILEVEQWPAWWPSVQSVIPVARGDPSGVGSIHRLTWKGRLPYRLSFDTRVSRIQRYEFVEGTASGELEGFGAWRFVSEGGTTCLRCEWVVITKKLWMNLLAPVLRTAFRWNHARVMTEGGEGLAHRLHCPLLSIAHESAVRVWTDHDSSSRKII